MILWFFLHLKGLSSNSNERRCGLHEGCMYSWYQIFGFITVCICDQEPNHDNPLSGIHLVHNEKTNFVKKVAVFDESLWMQTVLRINYWFVLRSRVFEVSKKASSLYLSFLLIWGIKKKTSDSFKSGGGGSTLERYSRLSMFFYYSFLSDFRYT